jgi:hypothetical protein
MHPPQCPKTCAPPPSRSPQHALTGTGATVDASTATQCPQRPGHNRAAQQAYHSINRHPACIGKTAAAVCERMLVTVTPAMPPNSPSSQFTPPCSSPSPITQCTSSHLPTPGLTYRVQPPAPPFHPRSVLCRVARWHTMHKRSKRTLECAAGCRRDQGRVMTPAVLGGDHVV